jgi:hypothetical protein
MTEMNINQSKQDFLCQFSGFVNFSYADENFALVPTTEKSLLPASRTSIAWELPPILRPSASSERL